MVSGTPDLWQCHVGVLDEGAHTVRVRATCGTGAPHADSIDVPVAADPPEVRPPATARPGRDEHSVGAWPSHGLLGTRLGSNRNGRQW
ncbi:MAG TPA: hypothetical protein VH328_00780 [Burkholderiaceae bacterium]|nr:hypothetical protein [Burkholderiaceae bacterium]